MSKIIAIDFGLKRTGLAITDELRIIAAPLITVDSHNLMDFLYTLFLKESVEVIVLGEPKRLDNSDTHISENVRLLKVALENQFPEKKVVLHDERFTSIIAARSMADAGMNKQKRKEKGNLDMISATVILQSYMDSIS
ncbi:MAG: Holliday junction resolvase RuvX [Flavobacteriia bacterium]